jgi:hypothetical protein
MSLCRFGWYEGGKVTRHVAGRPRYEIPADEPSFPAKLKKSSLGVLVVEAEMSGSVWYGRLMPAKKGESEGVVLLFERPEGNKEKS